MLPEIEQMFKMKKYHSTFAKRMELINIILDHNDCSTDEWLEKRNIKLEELTDLEIDKLIWMLKENI